MGAEQRGGLGPPRKCPDDGEGSLVHRWKRVMGERQDPLPRHRVQPSLKHQRFLWPSWLT